MTAYCIPIILQRSRNADAGSALISLSAAICDFDFLHIDDFADLVKSHVNMFCTKIEFLVASQPNLPLIFCFELD